MSTEDGPINVKNGIPTNVKVEYVKNNQCFEKLNNTMSFQTEEGENFIIISKTVGEFNIDGSKNNSSTDDNKWNYQEGIFIVSSIDSGSTWQCPINNTDDLIGTDIYQYPLMIMGGVNFKFACYDKFDNSVHIISTHFDDDIEYLADFVIDLNNINYKRALCEPLLHGEKSDGEKSDFDIEFLYRPPALDKNNTPWGEVLTLDTDIDREISDKFSRIMGESGSNSMITENANNLGNIHVIITEDGILNLQYDDITGVRMLFSTSSGILWDKSEIIIAKDATSGMFIDGLFFYITSDGIEMKDINLNMMEEARQAIKGKDVSFIEEVQRSFDDAETKLIGSGSIDDQRLSGYQDSKGVYYVFYYDNEGQLASLFTEDLTVWQATPNF